MHRSRRQLSARSASFTWRAKGLFLQPMTYSAYGWSLQCVTSWTAAEDRFAEARPAQVIERHLRVLDNIMQDGDDLRLLALDPAHDPQRVKDVRQALLVLLPFVRLGCDL